MNRPLSVLTAVSLLFASPLPASQGTSLPGLSILTLIPDLTPHALVSIPVAGPPGTDCALIDFEGLINGQVLGEVPGDVTVTFGPTWIGLIDLDDGGTGNFANEPSSNTIAFFQDDADPIDFDPPVRFVQLAYTTTRASAPVTVTAWSGPGGTGQPIDRVTGTVIGTDFDGAPCMGDPMGNFCLFDSVSLTSSSDQIRSITIEGVLGNNFGFDDMVFCTTDPLDPYCFGDGCPCGNDDSNAGCANSSGAGALLSAQGAPSVGGDQLQLTASNLPPQALGLLFMSQAPACTAFGDGLRAMTPAPANGSAGSSLFRYPAARSTNQGVMRYGPGIVAMSRALPPGGELFAGSTWSFQMIYRDRQGPCAQGFNVSNGMRVTFSL